MAAEAAPDPAGTVARLAPAKVNLYLHLCGRRPDGYHLLDSLVVFPAVGDRIAVEAADAMSLDVGGPFARGLPTGPDNLVLRAAAALARHHGIAAGAAGTLLVTVSLLMRSRYHAVVTGHEALLRETAEALEDFESEGWVQVSGERWRAQSAIPVGRKQKLRITRVDGLLLHVEPGHT